MSACVFTCAHADIRSWTFFQCMNKRCFQSLEAVNYWGDSNEADAGARCGGSESTCERASRHYWALGWLDQHQLLSNNRKKKKKIKKKNIFMAEVLSVHISSCSCYMYSSRGNPSEKSRQICWETGNMWIKEEILAEQMHWKWETKGWYTVKAERAGATETDQANDKWDF